MYDMVSYIISEVLPSNHILFYYICTRYELNYSGTNIMLITFCFIKYKC